MNQRVLLFFLTLFFLVTATIAVTLWAKGYSLSPKAGRSGYELEKSGMILAKSLPDGAKIFVDDKLVSATNATVSGLKGGKHRVRLEKEGFISWEKELDVPEELVLEIDAVLIPLTPELKPLTQTGARFPVISSDRSRVFYLAEKSDPSGVWYLPLAGGSAWFNLSRTTPRLLIADRIKAQSLLPKVSFSAAEKISVSPDDSEILLRMSPSIYYIVNLGADNTETAVATTSAEPTFKRWQKIDEVNRTAAVGKTKRGEAFIKTALEPTTVASPDGKRYLYRQKNGKSVEFHVRDLTEPLAVGDREDYLTFTAEEKALPKVFWYSDSRHLILLEDSTISIISIDGSNKTKIYSGNPLAGDIYPTPDGSKLIILTSFNPEASGDLYSIRVR